MVEIPDGFRIPKPNGCTVREREMGRGRDKIEALVIRKPIQEEKTDRRKKTEGGRKNKKGKKQAEWGREGGDKRTISLYNRQLPFSPPVSDHPVLSPTPE